MLNRNLPQQILLQICWGKLFVYCVAKYVLDRRGRLPLQGKIKLPYEKELFARAFVSSIELGGGKNDLAKKLLAKEFDVYFSLFIRIVFINYAVPAAVA